MDKLLQSWMANGYLTVADVKAADERFYKSAAAGGSKPTEKPAKSKFNNYRDENLEKYADLEEQLLDAMLDNDD